MTSLFWLSLILIVYAYGGYPIFLSLISLIHKKEIKKRPAVPTVSIILSAFNEEKYIERKLLNLLELDYPTEKLEILVGSDGCLDQTDEIISRFHSNRIRFFRFVKNLGKSHVLNDLVREAKGAVVVFTDARQEFDTQAIRTLVSNFEDPEVGCVSGELFFKRGDSEVVRSIAEGMGLYWRYEKFLRKKESDIGSTLGATGAIYAIRKSLFRELPASILVDDMYVPLSIIQKGHRVVFDGRAKAYDRVSYYGREEFRRKVRTLAGNYQIFGHFPELFIPFKSPIAWQLFSHKFLRLAAPFFLATLFVSNAFLLSERFYAVFFSGQVLFYGLALFEAPFSSSRSRRKGIGAIPYTFCLLNVSALVGLYKFLSRNQEGTWQKAYA